MTFKTDRKWVYIISAIALLAAVFITYFPALYTDIIGDDTMRIRDVFEFYKMGLHQAIQETMPDRPVLIFSVWLNTYFSGYNLFAFKLTNIIFHLLAGLSGLFFVFRLAPQQSQLTRYTLLLGALLWAAHPMNNQAIMSIIQRGISMSAGLFWLSMTCWVSYVRSDYKKNWLYLTMWLLLLISVATKPNIVMAPLMQMLICFWLNQRISKEDILRILPTFVIIFLPAISYLFLQIDPQNSPLTSVQYFWVQTEVVFKYFYKYFLPLDLAFYNNEAFELPPAFNFFRLAYLLGHIFILSIGFYYFFKFKNFAAFLLVLGYTCLLPESSFFPIKQSYFDHRNYLPLFFFLASLTCFIFNHLATQRLARKVALTGVTLFLIFLITENRNFIERNSTLHKFFVTNTAKIPIFFGLYIRFPLSEGRYAEAEEILNVAEKSFKDSNELNDATRDEIARIRQFLEIDKLKDLERISFIEMKINEIGSDNFSTNYYILVQKMINSEALKSQNQLLRARLLRDLHLKVAPIIANQQISKSLKTEIVRDLVAYLKSVGIEKDNYSELVPICQKADCLPAMKTILLLNVFFKVPFNQSEFELILKSHPHIKTDLDQAAAWLAEFNTEATAFK